jgi:hypothetical protein
MLRVQVEGYPTILYFKNGVEQWKYAGGREQANFVDYMKNPTAPPPPPPPEAKWSQVDSLLTCHVMRVMRVMLSCHHSNTFLIQLQWFILMNFNRKPRALLIWVMHHSPNF